MKKTKINPRIIRLGILIIIVLLFYNVVIKTRGEVIEIYSIENLLESKKNEYLYFGLSRCKVCEELDPIMEEMAKKYNKKIYYIDIYQYLEHSEFEEIQKKLILYGVPTIYKLEKGERKKRVVISKIDDENIKRIEELFK